jgi:hypothetical protein
MVAMEELLKDHSNEIMIVCLVAMVMATLIVIIPQLLRWHQRMQEMRHAERLKGIEQGLAMPPPDDRFRAAGRTAIVVPSVSVIVAGTVTCFMGAYRSENVLAVSIAAWSVAGIVSLAAITGGVALVGRLAQIDAGEEMEQGQEHFSRS